MAIRTVVLQFVDQDIDKCFVPKGRQEQPAERERLCLAAEWDSIGMAVNLLIIPQGC
jgi:hypothetical protein